MTPSASTPLLNYSVSPVTVNVSSTANLTLTIRNPSTTFTVTFGTSDSLIIQGLSTLTATPNSITPVAPASTDWNISVTSGPSGSYVLIWATSAIQIAPGQSFDFQLTGISVDAVTGQADLPVTESIGGQTSNPPDIFIGKLAQQLDIFALANPVTVGLSQTTSLQWTIVRGAWVTVVPGDGTQYRRTKPLNEPDSGSVAVEPLQTAPQTVYTLTVWQDQSTFDQTLVVVNLSPPIIRWFKSPSTAPLPIDATVQLSWQVLYATSVTLRPSAGAGFVPPEALRSITPAKWLPANASSVTFKLTAQGFQSQVSATLRFDFQPMRIAWFRYTDFTKSAFDYNVPNNQTISVSPLSAGTGWQLTATGPGGPVTQTLGGSGLEIQVFFADAPSAGSIKLQYQVQQALTLTLQPGGQILDMDIDGKGSVTVSPTVITTYSLVATGQNGTVTSELTVSPPA